MTPYSAPPEVISLIRFSTPGQVTDDKAGIEGQRQVNAATAARHGLRIRREAILIDVSGRHVMFDAKFQQVCEELKTDATLAGVLTAEQSRVFRADYDNLENYAILGIFKKHHKLIYTPDGIVDMNTGQGRMGAMIKSMMAGEELEILKERFMRGKAADRKARKHPGGNQMLPQTVRYVREYATNPNGKQVVTRTYWELEPLEAERMRSAFKLLFAGDSYEVIAEKIGGGHKGSSLRRLMMNPIHIGIRRYAFEAKGEEYDPKARPETYLKHDADWKPKKRRKLTKKEQVLDVPTREQLEHGAPPIVEPILTLEEWDRAQAIITRRTSSWRKSKLKNTGRERFLGNGIAYCSCGQALYGRYGSRGSHLDAYYCKTRFPSGPGCGMHSIKRTDVDPAIEATISRLCDADFLLGALKAALALRVMPVDPATAARERALAKLKTGRQNLVGALGDGEIDRESFRLKMTQVEAEIRALEAQVPAPPVDIDQRQIADAIVRTFTEFGFLSFVQKRALLRGAVRSVIVDSHARSITTVTVSGGYLGTGIGANSGLHSTRQSGISALDDLTIRLPEPVAIPDTYVDRRAANGQHPKTRATQFPRRAA